MGPTPRRTPPSSSPSSSAAPPSSPSSPPSLFPVAPVCTAHVYLIELSCRPKRLELSVPSCSCLPILALRGVRPHHQPGQRRDGAAVDRELALVPGGGGHGAGRRNHSTAAGTRRRCRRGGAVQVSEGRCVVFFLLAAAEEDEGSGEQGVSQVRSGPLLDAAFTGGTGEGQLARVYAVGNVGELGDDDERGMCRR